MTRREINPVPWFEEFGFSQGVSVERPGEILEISGQTSVDERGEPLHPGEMGDQVHQAMDNLQNTLEAAGFTFADVVRIMIFTTDVDRLLEHHDEIVSRLEPFEVRPASTLLGVAALAMPELIVEIQATAIR